MIEHGEDNQELDEETRRIVMEKDLGRLKQMTSTVQPAAVCGIISLIILEKKAARNARTAVTV